MHDNRRARHALAGPGPILHLADERARLAQLTWNNFDIKRLGATIGAEISGVDLTTNLPQPVIAPPRDVSATLPLAFATAKEYPTRGSLRNQ